MIVLNKKTIAVNDFPETLYKNPKTTLIASFFGEFSIINDTIVYANQLKVVERSKLKAVVNHSYFKGNYYLVEANLAGNIIFFEYHSQLEKAKLVYLKINL